MKVTSGFSRRGFLASLVVVAAGGALFLLLRRRRSPGADDEELVVALAGALSDPKAARAIGSAYLLAATSEVDAAELVDAIFSAPGWRGVAAADVPAQLRAQVREDFARGRTTIVGGWTLARSEARLCALVEVLARSGRIEAESS